MSIKYDPAALLSRVASPKKIKKLVSSNLTVKKAALSFVNDLDVINKASVLSVALKVLKNYKKRVSEADRGEKTELKKNLKKDPKLLINRVQNAVAFQMTQEIREKYQGEFYIWLPSDAEEPDPEHQLNYGKKFQVGVGEMPQDREGCRCGMEILVKESKLNI